MRHTTWVDSDESGDVSQNSFQAVCSDCNWSGRWIHADEYIYDADREFGAASDMAFNEAYDEGTDHEDDSEEYGSDFVVPV